jgi:hypothetical protein
MQTVRPTDHLGSWPGPDWDEPDVLRPPNHRLRWDMAVVRPDMHPAVRSTTDGANVVLGGPDMPAVKAGTTGHSLVAGRKHPRQLADLRLRAAARRRSGHDSHEEVQ